MQQGIELLIDKENNEKTNKETDSKKAANELAQLYDSGLNKYSDPKDILQFNVYFIGKCADEDPIDKNERKATISTLLEKIDPTISDSAIDELSGFEIFIEIVETISILIKKIFYEEAELLFKKFEGVAETKSDFLTDFSLIDFYFSYANLLLTQGRSKEEIEAYYLKTEQVINDFIEHINDYFLEDSLPQLIEYYNAAADFYKKNQSPEKEENYYRKAITLCLEQLTSNPQQEDTNSLPALTQSLAYLYKNLSDCFSTKQSSPSTDLRLRFYNFAHDCFNSNANITITIKALAEIYDAAKKEVQQSAILPQQKTFLTDISTFMKWLYYTHQKNFLPPRLQSITNYLNNHHNLTKFYRRIKNLEDLSSRTLAQQLQYHQTAIAQITEEFHQQSQKEADHPNKKQKLDTDNTGSNDDGNDTLVSPLPPTDYSLPSLS